MLAIIAEDAFVAHLLVLSPAPSYGFSLLLGVLLGLSVVLPITS